MFAVPSNPIDPAQLADLNNYLVDAYVAMVHDVRGTLGWFRESYRSAYPKTSKSTMSRGNTDPRTGNVGAADAPIPDVNGLLATFTAQFPVGYTTVITAATLPAIKAYGEIVVQALEDYKQRALAYGRGHAPRGSASGLNSYNIMFGSALPDQRLIPLEEYPRYKEAILPYNKLANPGRPGFIKAEYNWYVTTKNRKVYRLTFTGRAKKALRQATERYCLSLNQIIEIVEQSWQQFEGGEQAVTMQSNGAGVVTVGTTAADVQEFYVL